MGIHKQFIHVDISDDTKVSPVSMGVLTMKKIRKPTKPKKIKKPKPTGY